MLLHAYFDMMLTSGQKCEVITYILILYKCNPSYRCICKHSVQQLTPHPPTRHTMLYNVPHFTSHIKMVIN